MVETFTFNEIGSDWGLVFNVPTDPEQRQALIDAVLVINGALEVFNPGSTNIITLKLNAE